MVSVNVYLSDSPTSTGKENTKLSPEPPQRSSFKLANSRVPFDHIQQDTDEDDQETDNEFPEFDEINQTGLSGKIIKSVN